MKKKMMQAIFLLLFISGLIVGYLLPGDLKDFTKKPLQASILDVPKKMGQLDQESQYFKYSVLADAKTGSVELVMLDDKIPMHKHSNQNHFVYIYKGKVSAKIGGVTSEAGPGQLLVIPAGAAHSIQRIGDSPVEIMVFSTPAWMKEDTIFLKE